NRSCRPTAFDPPCPPPAFSAPQPTSLPSAVASRARCPRSKGTDSTRGQRKDSFEPARRRGTTRQSRAGRQLSPIASCRCARRAGRGRWGAAPFQRFDCQAFVCSFASSKPVPLVAVMMFNIIRHLSQGIFKGQDKISATGGHPAEAQNRLAFEQVV